ncbi:MAG: hypothetical protein ISS01_00180 [Nanoarchaeota archaeon]|nr:hypothetical protein [Nanoarchaeota archaeon]
MDLNVYKKSLNQWTKNLIVFVPDLSLIAFTYLLVLLINAYTGFGDIVSLLQNGNLESLDLLKEYFSANIFQLIISGTIFVVTTFFFGVGVYALKYEIIKDVVKGKKASIFKAYKISHKKFWQIVLMKIMVFLMSISVVLIVSFIVGLIYFIFSQFSVELARLLTLFVALVLILLAIFAIKLGILFRYPIMFMSNKNKAWSVLKESFIFFKKDPVYIFITWLFIFILSIVIWLFAGIINYGFGLIQNLSSNSLIIFICIILISLFGVLFNLIAEIWGSFILFDRYKN